jgi:hypothetical protein
MPRYPRQNLFSAVIVTLLVLGLFLISLMVVLRVTRATTVIRVTQGDSLQAKIDSAQSGDTLLLDAGAVFSAVTINKSNLVITTSQATSLPVIVGIADKANMARVETAGPDSAIVINGSGNKLIDLEVTTKQNPEYTGILVNVQGADNAIQQSYVHSLEDGTDNDHTSVKIGVFVGGPNLRIQGSRIALPGAKIMGSETFDNTAAVMNITEPGLVVDQCILNAWFTPYFQGGGDLKGYQSATITNPSMTGATFSNVTNLSVGTLVALADGPALQGYTGMYFEVARVTVINGNQVSYKPEAGSIGSKPDCVQDCGTPLKRIPLSPGEARWNGTNPSARITRSTFWINPISATKVFAGNQRTPKGWIEAKAGELYVEGNDFTGWPASITLTQHNQTGPHGGPSPWSKLSVVFRNNRVVNISRPFGSQIFSILGEDNIGTSVVGGPFIIENNLMAYGGWVGDFIASQNVTIRHNTFLNNSGWANGRLLNAIYIPMNGFVFENNIAWNNEYGMSTQSGGSLPGLQMAGNVLVTETLDPNRPNCANVYPAGNFCPQSLTLVDYQLPAGSPLKGKGADGKDPGVDYQALMAALGGSGNLPSPSPSPSIVPSPGPTPSSSPAPSPTPSPAAGPWQSFTVEDDLLKQLNDLDARGLPLCFARDFKIYCRPKP